MKGRGFFYKGQMLSLEADVMGNGFGDTIERDQIMGNQDQNQNHLDGELKKDSQETEGDFIRNLFHLPYSRTAWSPVN